MAPPIRVFVIQYGDKIPQKFLSTFNWSPQQAALLVSGIYTFEPETENPIDPTWPERDFSSLHMIVELTNKWRLTQAEYILKNWMTQHGYDQHTVSPESFLKWFSENPVPPLDVSGKPINFSINATKTLSPDSSSQIAKHVLKSRSDPLKAVIEEAKILATDPNDYHSVWIEIVKMAKSDARPSVLIEFVDEGKGEVKYDAGNKINTFTKDALRKRMVPSARGKNSAR